MAVHDECARPDRPAFVGLAAALIALTFALRLLYLAEPFDTDEGGYALIGRAWLAGQVPYRDLWDNKPPLTFLVHGAALAIADRPESVRLAAAAAVALATALTIAFGRALFDRRTALIAGAAVTLAWAAPRLQGTNANTEIFLLPGWIAAAWLAWRGARSGGWWIWIAAGAATGLAMAAKPVAGWLLPAAIGWQATLVRRGHTGARTAVERSALLLVGCGLAIAPWAIGFARAGALDDATHAVVGFNRLYLARNAAFALDRYGLGSMLFVPNREVVIEDPAIWLFGLAGLLAWPLIGFSRATAWLAIWTAAGWLGAKTGWLELPHYYLPLMPALAIWSAAYATRAWPRIAARRVWAGRAIALIAAGAIAWTLIASLPAWLAGDPAEFHRRKFPYPDRGEWDVAAPAIAARLRAWTAPDETVFIWGREPQIYYHAGRRPASRYIHDRPVWIELGVLETIRADLARVRPPIVLDTLDPAFFPEATAPVAAVLPPDYLAAGRIGFARVYARPDRAPALGELEDVERPLDQRPIRPEGVGRGGDPAD